MKKILVLMLVLGLATAANATMSLTIQDVPSSMEVDDSAVIAINDSVGYVSGDDLYFVLVADTGLATISGGSVMADTQDTSILGTATGIGYDGTLGDGIGGYVGSTGGTAFGPGDYIYDIDLAADAQGTVTVYLLTTVDFAEWTTADSAEVTITPEPITLALLGLGGLFIRRK